MLLNAIHYVTSLELIDFVLDSYVPEVTKISETAFKLRVTEKPVIVKFRLVLSLWLVVLYVHLTTTSKPLKILARTTKMLLVLWSSRLLAKAEYAFLIVTI